MSSLLHPNKGRDDRLRRSLIRLFLKRGRSTGEKFDVFNFLSAELGSKGANPPAAQTAFLLDSLLAFSRAFSIYSIHSRLDTSLLS